MPCFKYALMDLTVTDGRVHSAEGQQPFDSEEYSRFKYGWLPPAIGYAQGLAALIADQLWETSGGRPIYIVSAPYKCVPTASHAIAQYLCRDLEMRAIQAGLEPPTLVPFRKAKPGDSTYARSSRADRLATVAALGLQIDESLVPGSVLLVVDDIRITGAAQAASAAYLESLEPYAVWYLHAARLSEAVAQANPGLEDELNQTAPNTLTAILRDVEAGEFQLNTRVLRRMLESGPSDFWAFANVVPLHLLEEIYQGAIGSGPDYCNRYAERLRELRTELLEHGSTMPSLTPPAPTDPLAKGNSVCAIPKGVTAISFDIWNTLLRGNSAFTRPRLRLIFDHLGYPEVDIEQLYQAYKQTEEYFDRKMESSGLDFNMGPRLHMMCELLGLDDRAVKRSRLDFIQNETGKLRRQPEYRPTLIEPDLPDTLAALRAQRYTLGLLSNTGMDNEQVMVPLLQDLGIWHFFDVAIFSSEDGRAKPDPELFRRMAKELGAEPDQVLHVGDNTRADYHAIEAGLHAVVYAPSGIAGYPHIRSMRELIGQ